MFRTLSIALLTMFSASALAKADCQALDERAQTADAMVMETGSGRDIVGKGRVQFYSGPTLTCKMPGIFVIPGDLLFASYQSGAFTRVSFIALRKTDKKDVEGWVLTSRLRENGNGIVPGVHIFQ